MQDKIQTVRTHTCVAMDLLYPSVVIETIHAFINVLHCHQLFVLQCHSWFSNLVEGTCQGFVKQTELCPDVTTPGIQ